MFGDPFAFENEIVCLEGYYFNSGQPMLHMESSPDRDAFYDIAVLLDGGWQDIAPASVVWVRGKVSINEHCWFGVEEPGQVYECVPFKRLIDLEVLEIELRRGPDG